MENHRYEEFISLMCRCRYECSFESCRVQSSGKVEKIFFIKTCLLYLMYFFETSLQLNNTCFLVFHFSVTLSLISLFESVFLDVPMMKSHEKSHVFSHL